MKRHRVIDWPGMEFKDAEKWWKRKDHRRIHGSRGHRFVSLKFHAIFAVGVVGSLEYLLRADDVPVYRAPAPPVEAPPPLPKSLGYTLTSESPYLKSLELEGAIPQHVPQKSFVNFEQLRTGKASDNKPA